jgi:hypothetical protein
MNPLLILGGFVALMLLLKSNAAQNLRITPNGVNISGGKLIINFQIVNPSSQSITINSFVGDLFQRGNAVGKVTFFGPISIAPNNATNIPVLISLNPLGLASEIASILSDGFSLKGFTIAATINAEGITINKNFVLS